MVIAKQVSHISYLKWGDSDVVFRVNLMNAKAVYTYSHKL